MLVGPYFEKEVKILESGTVDDMERIERLSSAGLVVLAVETAIMMIPSDEQRSDNFEAVLRGM